MSATSDPDLGPVPALLDAIRHQGKAWAALAPSCGVTNPDPPWKTSLVGMWDCLAVGGTLPALERRLAEDKLADAVYTEVPAPERDLLALAHMMLSRGLVSEDDLARRMGTVRSRLESA